MGITLKPHQVKAVDDVRAIGGVALIVSGTGSGKTFIAADIIKRILAKWGGCALYVTQASAIRQQVEKLCVYGLEASTEPDSTVRVISHERMRMEAKTLQSTPFTIVVVDEMHKVLATTKSTTKALIGDHRSKGIFPRFRIGMTATPTPNGLKECYSYLKWLHPDCTWKSTTAFRNECLQPHPRIEHQWIGVYPHKFDQLSKMMADITVNVDYTPSYVEPITRKIEVTLTTEERQAYDKIKEDGLIELANQPTVILANMAVIDGKLRQMVAHPEALGFTTLANSKHKALLDLLATLKGKTLIFCQFKSVLKILHEKHGWPMIAGGVSMKRRNEILDSQPDVLLMSAAGEASLDIQWATNIVQYDLPWNQAHIDQRNGRIAREGQNKQTYIYYLTAKDTVDERVASIVRRKLLENLKAYRLCNPKQK